MNTGAAPAWSSRIMRLDPHALPHTYVYATGLPEDAGVASVVLERHRALVARRLPRSDAPLAMKLPVHAFEGVAARSHLQADGSTTVTLELMHRDPALSLPLLVCRSADEAVADWRAWSKVLSLPLLAVDRAGEVKAIAERLGSLTVLPVAPRRRSTILGKRCSRSRLKRWATRIGPAPVVQGREIANWEADENASRAADERE